MSDETFTPRAAVLWGTIPQVARARILANVFCVKCRGSVQITNFTGEERNGDVYLKGSCAKCGHEVMRLVEISEWDSSVTAALVYRPCYPHAWLVVRLFWNAELVAATARITKGKSLKIRLQAQPSASAHKKGETPDPKNGVFYSQAVPKILQEWETKNDHLLEATIHPLFDRT